jgi:uncharacterized SAM-binding protein YcdF (DUF218 family)
MTLLRGALLRAMVVAGGGCLLWLAGLLWFASPPALDSWSGRTDAIVVLTGGSLRLQSGVELLREGKGRKLFVSGVSHQVDLGELLRLSGNDADWAAGWAACCVVLGHDADNTFGNAQETARWMRSQGFRSLRLVTAWYHMPRSLLEFYRAMPEIDIVAHPVFPDQVRREHWWAWRGTTALLVNEYDKYLGTLVLPWIEARQPAQTANVDDPARVEMRR